MSYLEDEEAINAVAQALKLRDVLDLNLVLEKSERAAMLIRKAVAYERQRRILEKLGVLRTGGLGSTQDNERGLPG